MEPIAYTIPEFAKVSGTSRTAIYEALRRGELTAKKRGKRTIIEASVGKAWVASLPAYEPARAA